VTITPLALPASPQGDLLQATHDLLSVTGAIERASRVEAA